NKKEKFKSRSKSIRISDSVPSSNSILVDTDDSTKKITSKDLDVLYEKEARRDEKNITNMTRLLAST
ncbi:15111_t:CDS:1, partial [Dentiscutata heterogama]